MCDGMVRFGVIWFVMMRFGVIGVLIFGGVSRHHMSWRAVFRCDLIWCGVSWCGVSGLVLFGMVRCGVTW